MSSPRSAAGLPAGLADVAAQLAQGPQAIAYLGHSVTLQKEGYRPNLHANLVRHFGHEHRQINAAFGAVGSVVSACVADQMVIQRHPTLCFIECLVGDLGIGLQADTGAALEGILRKLALADCAACFLNLPRRDTVAERDGPLFDLYARIAAHYRVPVIDLSLLLSTEGQGYFRDVAHSTPQGGRLAGDLILENLAPLFATPASRAPLPERLFARDFTHASASQASTAQLRRPQDGREARFRLGIPCVEFDTGNEIVFESPDHELLGILAVIGPDSGPARIADRLVPMIDAWTTYERLHGIVFDPPFPPGVPVPISLLENADGAGFSKRLRINAFLTRPR